MLRYIQVSYVKRADTTMKCAPVRRGRTFQLTKNPNVHDANLVRLALILTPGAHKSFKQCY